MQKADNFKVLEDAVYNLIVNNHEKFEMEEQMRFNENFKRIQTLKRRQKIMEYQDTFHSIRANLDIIDKIMTVNPRATLLQSGVVPLDMQSKVS